MSASRQRATCCRDDHGLPTASADTHSFEINNKQKDFSHNRPQFQTKKTQTTSGKASQTREPVIPTAQEPRLYKLAPKL